MPTWPDPPATPGLYLYMQTSESTPIVAYFRNGTWRRNDRDRMTLDKPERWTEIPVWWSWHGARTVGKTGPGLYMNLADHGERRFNGMRPDPIGALNELAAFLKNPTGHGESVFFRSDLYNQVVEMTQRALLAAELDRCDAARAGSLEPAK